MNDNNDYAVNNSTSTNFVDNKITLRALDFAINSLRGNDHDVQYTPSDIEVLITLGFEVVEVEEGSYRIKGDKECILNINKYMLALEDNTLRYANQIKANWQELLKNPVVKKYLDTIPDIDPSYGKKDGVITYGDLIEITQFMNDEFLTQEEADAILNRFGNGLYITVELIIKKLKEKRDPSPDARNVLNELEGAFLKSLGRYNPESVMINQPGNSNRLRPKKDSTNRAQNERRSRKDTNRRHDRQAAFTPTNNIAQQNSRSNAATTNDRSRRNAASLNNPNSYVRPSNTEKWEDYENILDTLNDQTSANDLATLRLSSNVIFINEERTRPEEHIITTGDINNVHNVLIKAAKKTLTGREYIAYAMALKKLGIVLSPEAHPNGLQGGSDNVNLIIDMDRFGPIAQAVEQTDEVTHDIFTNLVLNATSHNPSNVSSYQDSQQFEDFQQFQELESIEASRLQLSPVSDVEKSFLLSLEDSSKDKSSSRLGATGIDKDKARTSTLARIIADLNTDNNIGEGIDGQIMQIIVNILNNKSVTEGERKITIQALNRIFNLKLSENVSERQIRNALGPNELQILNEFFTQNAKDFAANPLFTNLMLDYRNTHQRIQDEDKRQKQSSSKRDEASKSTGMTDRESRNDSSTSRTSSRKEDVPTSRTSSSAQNTKLLMPLVSDPAPQPLTQTNTTASTPVQETDDRENINLENATLAVYALEKLMKKHHFDSTAMPVVAAMHGIPKATITGTPSQRFNILMTRSDKLINNIVSMRIESDEDRKAVVGLLKRIEDCESTYLNNIKSNAHNYL